MEFFNSWIQSLTEALELYTAEPATNILAPASTAALILDLFIPPSISISVMRPSLLIWFLKSET